MKDVKQENKSLLVKYLICFGVAALITVMVFAIKGFFTDSWANNLQVLSDGFCVSGALMIMFAGLMFISGEGGFIGIGFVIRNVVLTFVPMGRAKHELYKDYRERKLSEIKKSTDHCVLFVGLAFLAIGIIFTVIWYVKFYNITG
ncbi:MAG: DUF3899 domain-containing protein [Clostridia bacterium]|nr:DUF3899 domain-containing protein [Clostridia bacterium]